MIIREIAKRVGCSYDVARLFLLGANKLTDTDLKN